MDEPQHLPHCKPIRINWVGTPGPPSAGWQCVAECPNYRARMERNIADAQSYFAQRYPLMDVAQTAGRGPTPST